MDKVISWSVAISQIFFVIDIIIFLPMSFIKKTKKFAGKGLVFSSFIFGITVWLLGAIITFSYWGIVALIIGLVLMGVGVIPMGMVACFINGLWIELIFLVIGSILIFVTRAYGLSSIERY